jgi:subtilisin family serine protease
MIMKKTIMTLAAVLCCILSIEAQTSFQKTKMSPWLHAKYSQEMLEVKKNGGPKRIRGLKVRNYILALVKNTDEAAAIREAGGVVLQDFGNDICAAFLPIDQLGELDRNPHILQMEANAPSQLQNDTSAVILGTDKAWNGKGPASYSQPTPSLSQAFTGKGVFAAVMDVGFDFTHPAFRNADGTSRIKWFWDPMAPDANNDQLGMIYSSPTEVLVAQHSSDALIDGHGTHVMGSMAGAGLNGRYVGMAPEADILGFHMPISGEAPVPDDYWVRLADYLKSHSSNFAGLEDAIVKIEPSVIVELVGLHEIFKVADAAGQPCVVNWSFGTTPVFSVDMRLYEDVFNSMVGPGHIVVNSAGNMGDMMIYLAKAAGEPLDHEFYLSTNVGYSIVTMRTEAEEPDFELKFAFDDRTDTLVFNTGDIKTGCKQTDCFRESYEDFYIQFEVIEAYDGRLIYQIAIGDPKVTSYEITEEEFRKSGKLICDAIPKIEMLGGVNNTYQFRFSQSNLVDSRGCNPGTIGVQCDMDRIISVGAMNHRSSFTNILGENYTPFQMGSEEGHLTSFSSCGPTLQGRIKPDVVAPGFNIISCYNSFYHKTDASDGLVEDILPKTAYADKAFGRTYAMVTMSGTSMACPITAGIIALWLQAKPDLTPEDIMGVIERTSHQPEPDFSGEDKNIYYGWGEIDAYAGLLDILGLTGIREISKHQPAGLKFRLEGYTLHIDGIDNSETVTVFDLSGHPVLRTETSSDGILSLSGLSTGIYAVQVGHRGSTLIRFEL